MIRDEKDRKFWKFWNNRDDAKSVHLGSCVAQPIEYKHANDRAGLGHGILSTRRLQNWIFRITYTRALKLTVLSCAEVVDQEAQSRTQRMTVKDNAARETISLISSILDQRQNDY